MKRRTFLKTLAALAVVGGLTPSRVLAEPPSCGDDHVKDYLQKMKCFNQPHQDDICLKGQNFCLLKSSVMRFRRLQGTVGHGNFHLLGFDEAIKIAKNYSRVRPFEKGELNFLEEIFYNDSSLYGFFGEKPVKELTARVKTSKVIKIRRSGNYLYKGMPLETYRDIKRCLGGKVILTSGVRGVVKQFFLFLNKAYANNGNLSLASRSLAPPGYSFHSVSDFDVGQVNFGPANFTEHFVETEVYSKLKELGYLKLRYPLGNHLGVRFEPWHIKVNSIG